MNQWTLALRQIKRNPLRSLLMAVGVFAFAMVVVSVTLLLVGINQSITRTVNRLGADIMLIPRGEQIAAQFNEALITGRPTSFYLPQERIKTIAQLEGVDRIATQTYAQTLTNARCCAGHFFLVGFDRTNDFTIQPWLSEPMDGWPPDEQDWVIVGDRIMLNVGEEVQFYGTHFKVAGVLGATGSGMDWTVYVPQAGLRRMVMNSAARAVTPLEIDADKVSAFFIRTTPGSDLIDLAEHLEQSCPDCQAVLSSAVGKLARFQLKAVTWVALGVVMILWFVAALLSGVVFAQAVRERRAEIGLFLAKGADRGFVIGMLAKESLMISTLACLGGAAGALLVVTSFRQLLAMSLGVPQVLPNLLTMLLLITGLCVFGIGSALLCSFWPARRLLRTEPYEAIKGGGAS